MCGFGWRLKGLAPPYHDDNFDFVASLEARGLVLGASDDLLVAFDGICGGEQVAGLLAQFNEACERCAGGEFEGLSV